MVGLGEGKHMAARVESPDHPERADDHDQEQADHGGFEPPGQAASRR
jgi:hypothetical protein